MTARLLHAAAVTILAAGLAYAVLLATGTVAP